MIRLRVNQILEEQGKSKYWLCKNLGMCYRNFQKIVNCESKSVRFETLERLCEILNVPVGDLFEEVPDEKDNS